MKRFSTAVFLCLLVGSGFDAAFGAEEVELEVLTLEDAVNRAVLENPNLAQTLSRYQAMAAIPSQVGTRPDPMLSFSALNMPVDTFDLSQEPMTQLQLGVSQVLPFPGKLALREEAADHDANAAKETVEETRLMLMRDVRTRWWTLFYLDRALEIVDRNQELLRQFVVIAKTKYEVGDGLQQDVLLAQVELSKLFDQSIALTGFRKAEAARLNQLLDQPADLELVLPTAVSLDLPDVASEGKLYERAEALRPRLLRKQNQIRAAQSRLKLAKKDYYPDFSIGAAYGARSGDNPANIGGARSDFLSVGLSINLPIYQTRKRAQAVSQRDSELMSERYALQDEINLVRRQISEANADFIQARDQFSLFGTGIIPQARQTVESMLAGYQVSEVDFLNLVQSQITLFNYETLYWRALAAANQSLAELKAAVGEENIGE